MIVIPAIDLREGKVVRLTQGRFDRETVYPDRPLDLARRFLEEGARRIHLVDLEGARQGRPCQKELIEEILHAAPGTFQVGGGIRDPKVMDAYLRGGALRVVVGTRACLDPGFLKETLGAFAESVIVGVDASAGKIAVDGWTKVTDLDAGDFIKSVIDCGGREVIYTDIARDGALGGPNLDAIRDLLARFDVRLIASGGIATLADIAALAALKNERLLGVIVGKAILERKISLKEALKRC